MRGPCVKGCDCLLVTERTQRRAVAGGGAETSAAESDAAAAMADDAVMAPADQTDDTDVFGLNQFTRASDHQNLFGNGLEARPIMSPFLAALKHTTVLPELADDQVRLIGLLRGQRLASRLHGRITTSRRKRRNCGRGSTTSFGCRAAVSSEKTEDVVEGDHV